jgi:glycosyltransferase involved in cell wall biosynthesis
VKEEIMTSRKASILLIDFTLLDLSVNKTTFPDILQQFSRIGYQFSLITARSNKMPQIKNLQGRIILIPLKRIPYVLPAMYAIFMFFFLPLYILIIRPDFVIMEPNVHIISAFPSALISKLKKIKIVLDVRSIPVETVGLRGNLEKFWFYVSVVTAKKLFDGITIITPLMKKELCSNFDINSTKIGVWTSGVSDSLFDPENLASRGSGLKRKLGLSGKFVVFYHGVFAASRGLDETIEAIKLLKPMHPEIVFFLLGNGSIVNRLKALIQKEGLQENVIIHNPVEQLEVPKFIDFCDVGIVPLPYNVYWRFQSPLKLLEYLSMKKVVIVSDIPAHRLVVNGAKCAIYLSSVTPEEIAKSIEYAYNNRDKLSSWGNAGREIILREYTWEKVAKDLENYLVSLNEE